VGKPVLRDNLLYLMVFGPGTGESIVLRLPGDPQPVWCVVDSCSIDGASPADRVLDEYDARLSLLVLSHPHDDHATRFVDLFRRLTDSGRVGAAWPRLPEESWGASLRARSHHLRGAAEDAVAGILQHWQSSPAQRWEMARGQCERLGTCRVRVLNPDRAVHAAGFPQNINRLSTALLIEWQDCRLLIGGDVENPDWSDIQAAGYGLDHAGCKVPHHGSSRAHHSAWLNGDKRRGWCITPWHAGRLPWSTAGDMRRLLAAVESVHLTSGVGMPRRAPAGNVQKHGTGAEAPGMKLLGDIELERVELPADHWAHYVVLGFDAAGRVVDTQFGAGSVSLS